MTYLGARWLDGGIELVFGGAGERRSVQALHGRPLRFPHLGSDLGRSLGNADADRQLRAQAARMLRVFEGAAMWSASRRRSR